MARPEVEADSLRRTYASSELPVPVDRIARELKVELVEKPLADDVSGLLVRADGGGVAIVVNEKHSEVRRRFTIAHELGHLVLHKGRPLVVDRVRVNLRNARSSVAVDQEEIEADAFAAEPLMPRALVVAEVNHAADRVGWSTFAADLAVGFNVSPEAMAYRLVNLGISSQV